MLLFLFIIIFCFLIILSLIYLIIKNCVIQNDESDTKDHNETPGNSEGKGKWPEHILLERLVREGLIVEETRKDVHHEGRPCGTNKTQDKVETADKEGDGEGSNDNEHANKAVTENRMPAGRLAFKEKAVNVVASRVELDGIPASNNKHKR